MSEQCDRRGRSAIRRLWSTFWPYLKPQRTLVVGGLLGLLGATLMRILEPWPLKFVIDRITGFSGERARVNLDALRDMDTDLLLLGAAAALVLIALMRAAMAYASTIAVALAGNRTLSGVRSALFAHLHSLSLRFHGKSRGGDIVTRMISDVGMVQEVAVTAALPLAGSLLVLIGMFVVMFLLDVQLAAIAFICVPLLALATLRRGHRIRTAAHRTRRHEGALASTAAESISAIKTVQSMALGQRFQGAFAAQNNANLAEGVRVRRLSAGLERSVDVLIAAATAAVLWFGARRVTAGELSPGELLVFLFYLKGAFRPLRDFAKYGARIAKASAAADRIMELFETRSEVIERTGAQELDQVQGHLRFNTVSFAYEHGNPVLHDITFDIPAGTHIAIVGPSGSGKSTLAALTLRLYDPDQGSVSLDGVDVRDLKLDSLRGCIGTVLQDTVLFAASIRDNIALGVEGAGPDAIEAAARLANAHDFIASLPQGYDTPVGERGATLSNGQRQRIAIARAALRDAPILILDEPTTGLDPENERLVLQALNRLAQNKTTLHITHRIGAARGADRILVVQQGRIVEDGKHTDLLRKQGAYAALQRIHSTDEVRHRAG